LVILDVHGTAEELG